MTKQNADNAEESASASEQMSAQEEEMKSIVQELAQLIGEAASDREWGTSDDMGRHTAARRCQEAPSSTTPIQGEAIKVLGLKDGNKGPGRKRHRRRTIILSMSSDPPCDPRPSLTFSLRLSGH